ncbi:hypothetical protein BFX06_14715 [Sulfobacillus thermosulfidooxidans]|nr:hypothetical protein BFX05_05880 [Sulfobacillus thermosulfidooxidans]OLZ16748.1 hypothetical protein BFX06_14715 [Sulfobacillus thermosulfidooxidans]OLZ20703.1 hypothetical protein BFX07_14565 [Sulfobacillus thermosulfidooxidans]
MGEGWQWIRMRKSIQIAGAMVSATFCMVMWIQHGKNVYAATDNWVNVTYNGEFNKPLGIAVDTHGDIFVVNSGSNTLEELPSGSTTWKTISGSFDAPADVAVDGNGDVFVTNEGNNTIEELPIGSTTWKTISGPFDNPWGIAIDSHGDIFVANNGNNTVEELPSGSTTWQSVSGPFNMPQGIAVDAQGDLFVVNNSDTGSNGVVELVNGSSTWKDIAPTSAPRYPNDVAVDGFGNIFVTYFNQNATAVEELPSGSSTWMNIADAQLVNYPEGIAVSSTGNVYVSNFSINTISEYPPAIPHWTPPVLTPEPVTVGNISGQVIGDLGFNPITAIQQGTYAGYVEERAAVEAGATFTGEGTNSAYLSAILDGSGVDINNPYVTPEQQGQFAALYQKLGVIPTWTDNTVNISQGVTDLIKAHAPTLAIENYLVQMAGYSWSLALDQAQSGFPIQER